MGDQRTPLHPRHADAGARFTGFGGWEMPVSFEGIAEEHEAVRTAAGRFDVSHMGEIDVGGADATTLMQRLTTNDVTALGEWEGQYAAITDVEGVILDDTIVFRYGDVDGEARFRFIPNAGHNEAMAARWEDHREKWALDATVTDRTAELAMIAIQGPDAIEQVAAIAADDPGELDRFACTPTSIAGVEAIVSRTGYTGEDGVEIICASADAETLWAACSCQRCGLGARDTLRLEAGLLLGGNEFDPEDNPRTPIEAGIGFAVDLETDFVGREALAAVDQEGPTQRLVGLGMVDRGIPRHGYALLSGDETVGMVTSGTKSPSLDRPIALGYLDAALAEPGTDVDVRIRDEPRRGKVESLPFVS